MGKKNKTIKNIDSKEDSNIPFPKNKTVVIVTGFEGENYGTKLQSTALCHYFESLGYKTYIIGSFRVYSFMLKHPAIFLNRIRCKIESKRTQKFFNAVPYQVSDDRKNRIAEYNRHNYRALHLNDDKTWKAVIDSNAIFVIGSDIIWQPSFGAPGRWFADYAYYAGLRIFSYATSIGALSLPKEYYPLYKRYLGSYISVGVREKQSVDMLEPIIGREVTNVIDPTLLIDKSGWGNFSKHAEVSVDVKEGKYILCYFVMNDPRYWEYVKIVFSAYPDYDVVVLPMHQIDEEQPYKVIKDGTPYEFVKLIKEAAFILTDSFHTCAFSLNFNKEFYLMPRSRKDETQKTRISWEGIS